MSKEDDVVFDESVKNDGIRDPLTLNQDFVLLDGHSRYAKAIKYGYQEIPFTIKKFTDKLLEEKYVIECNLQRRHLTNYQKVELAIPLIAIEAKLAAQRKKSGLKQNEPSGSNDPNDKGKTVEKVAKQVGVSPTTLMRGKKIYEEAPEHLKAKARSGKTSINSIYNHITRKERNLPKVILPDGKWSVVQVDLPIQFNDTGVRGSSTNNYETIPIPALKLGMLDGKDVRECFDENCVIFAWFQASTIFYAKEILEAWGFHCITNQIWDKEIIGTGSWLANMHEHLVIAVKGKMPIPAKMFESVIHHKRNVNNKHSTKPIIFYDEIELMYPERNYLDLFSRYKHNEKWTCFGNEVAK